MVGSAIYSRWLFACMSKIDKLQRVTALHAVDLGSGLRGDVGDGLPFRRNLQSHAVVLRQTTG